MGIFIRLTMLIALVLVGLCLLAFVVKALVLAAILAACVVGALFAINFFRRLTNRPGTIVPR